MNNRNFRVFLDRVPSELKITRDALAKEDFALARSAAGLLRERGTEVDSKSFWYTAFALERACRLEELDKALDLEHTLTREFLSLKEAMARLGICGEAEENPSTPSVLSGLPPQQELATLVRLNADRFRHCIERLASGEAGEDEIVRARRTLNTINGIINFLGLHSLKVLSGEADSLLEELQQTGPDSEAEIWDVFTNLADLYSDTISHLTQTGTNAEALAIEMTSASSPTKDFMQDSHLPGAHELRSEDTGL